MNDAAKTMQRVRRSAVLLLVMVILAAMAVAVPPTARAGGDFFALPTLPSTAFFVPAGQKVVGTNEQLTAVDPQFKVIFSVVKHTGMMTVNGLGPVDGAKLPRVSTVTVVSPLGPVDGYKFLKVDVPTPDPGEPCCDIVAPTLAVGSIFDLTPDANLVFGGSYVVVSYSEAAISALGARESDVRLMHFEGGVWVDATVAPDQAEPCCNLSGNPDTAKNAVAGRVTSFSPFMVTVRDTVAPIVTAPGDLTVECNAPGGATGVNPGTATASDNLNVISTPESNAPSFFPLGTTRVTWTAKDPSGNRGTAVQSVVVRDTKPPAIAFANGDLSVTDTCDASVVVMAGAPQKLTTGASQITWTATDSSGNSATFVQTVPGSSTADATSLIGLGVGLVALFGLITFLIVRRFKSEIRNLKKALGPPPPAA